MLKIMYLSLKIILEAFKRSKMRELNELLKYLLSVLKQSQARTYVNCVSNVMALNFNIKIGTRLINC